VKAILELRGLVSGAIRTHDRTWNPQTEEKSINFVISAYVDTPASHNAGGAVRVRAGHQFVLRRRRRKSRNLEFPLELGVWDLEVPILTAASPSHPTPKIYFAAFTIAMPHGPPKL
jgi:hypothetical protein